MKETPRRRITVTSSLDKISKDQLEIGWLKKAILLPLPHLSTVGF
jgi:hypothetical protein